MQKPMLSAYTWSSSELLTWSFISHCWGSWFSWWRRRAPNICMRAIACMSRDFLSASFRGFRALQLSERSPFSRYASGGSTEPIAGSHGGLAKPILGRDNHLKLFSFRIFLAYLSQFWRFAKAWLVHGTWPIRAHAQRGCTWTVILCFERFSIIHSTQMDLWRDVPWLISYFKFSKLSSGLPTLTIADWVQFVPEHYRRKFRSQTSDSNNVDR